MHCVDLGESFPTHILLQNLASIQPRTSPIKFAHLAEQGSISNLSTKPRTEQAPRDAHLPLHGLRAVHEGDEGPGADGTSEGSTF